MPKAGLAYDRPSRTSQALIVGFSLAVVLMTGWLVLMIMFAPEANTMTVNATPALTPPESPRVENPPPDNRFPLTRKVRSVSATQPQSPWGDGIASIPALPAAPSATPGAAWAATAAIPATAAAPTSGEAPAPAGYAPSSTGAGDVGHRAAATDYLNAPGASEAEIGPVPLPHPRPRHLASIPVPRPRPHIDEAPEAPPEKSLFDLLIERQR